MGKQTRQRPDGNGTRRAGVGFGPTKARFASRSGEAKCLLCGLCIRACKAVLGQAVIGVSRLDDGQRVVAPLAEAPEACTGCKACERICPTGAYIDCSDDGPVRHMTTWHAELELVPCAVCGKPFATARELDLARAKVQLKFALDTICPSCRRSQTARRLAAAKRPGHAGVGP